MRAMMLLMSGSALVGCLPPNREDVDIKEPDADGDLLLAIRARLERV